MSECNVARVWEFRTLRYTDDTDENVTSDYYAGFNEAKPKKGIKEVGQKVENFEPQFPGDMHPDELKFNDWEPLLNDDVLFFDKLGNQQSTDTSCASIDGKVQPPIKCIAEKNQWSDDTFNTKQSRGLLKINTSKNVSVLPILMCNGD